MMHCFAPKFFGLFLLVIINILSLFSPFKLIFAFRELLFFTRALTAICICYSFSFIFFPYMFLYCVCFLSVKPNVEKTKFMSSYLSLLVPPPNFRFSHGFKLYINSMWCPNFSQLKCLITSYQKLLSMSPCPDDFSVACEEARN